MVMATMVISHGDGDRGDQYGNCGNCNHCDHQGEDHHHNHGKGWVGGEKWSPLIMVTITIGPMLRITLLMSIKQALHIVLCTQLPDLKGRPDLVEMF